MANALPCMTCELVARRDRGEAPLWDNIYRTAHWDLVHSYNTALPGWLVRERKVWPYASRIDNVYGDRNLFCLCIPIEEYA